MKLNNNTIDIIVIRTNVTLLYRFLEVDINSDAHGSAVTSSLNTTSPLPSYKSSSLGHLLLELQYILPFP